MVQTMTLTKEGAAEAGYAQFNNGPHLCVDVPDGNFTITCKNSEGKKVTFAFCPNATPRDTIGGHHCVDVVHHSHLDTDGYPVQQASFLGRGPTNAVCSYHDKVATTVVVLSLQEASEPIPEPSIK